MVETARSFGVQVGLDASRFSTGINAVNGACTSSTKRLSNVGVAVNSMQSKFSMAGARGSAAMSKLGAGADRLFSSMTRMNPMMASFAGGMITAAGAMGMMKLKEMSDELVTVELNVARANVMLGGSPALVSKIVSQLDIFATKIPGTSTEISDSIYLIVSAMDKVGKSAEEVFDVAMVYVEKFAQAAAITGSDINVITRSVMQMTYAFGGTVEDVDKILGLALKTVAGGFITFDQYAHAVEHASTQAALAGLSLEEMNAAIIIMTTGGVAATFVGSRLAGTITYLTRSAGSLKEKFEAVGVEVYDLDTGKMKPLIEVIDIFNKEIGHLTDLEMAEWFHKAGIVGAEVKQGIIPLISGYEKLGMTIEDLTDVQGVLQDQFNSISGTLWAKLDAVRSSIRMVWKASAEAVMVILSPFINLIIRMGAVFANLPRPMKLTIGLFLALGTAILVVSGSILTMWGMIGMMGMGVAQAGTAATGAAVGTKAVTSSLGMLNQKLAVTKVSLLGTSGILGGLKVKLIAASAALKGFVLNLWAGVGGLTGINASIGAATLRIKAFTLQQFFAKLSLGKFTAALSRSAISLKTYTVGLWTSVGGLNGVSAALWSVTLRIKALGLALITSPVFIWITGLTVTLFILYKAFKNNIGGMRTATDDLKKSFGKLFDVLGPFRTIYSGVVEGVVAVMRLMVDETTAFINMLVEGINVITSFGAKVIGIGAPLLKFETILKGIGKTIGVLIGAFLMYSSVMFSVTVVRKAIVAYKALALAIKSVSTATNMSTISAKLNTIALKASSFATWTTAGAKNLLTGATRTAHLARLVSVGSLVAEKAALVASTLAMGVKKVATIALSVVTKIITAVQWLWNIALSANPIGVIIMAIAALVAGITWLIVKVIGVNRIMGAFATVGKIVGTAIGWLVDRIKSLVGWFTSGESGSKGFGQYLLLLIGPIGLVILAFKNLDKIRSVVTNGIKWLTDSFGNFTKRIEEVGDKFRWLKSALLLLLGPIGLVILTFKNFDKIAIVLGTVKEAFGVTFNAIVSTVKQAWDVLLGFFGWLLGHSPGGVLEEFASGLLSLLKPVKMIVLAFKSWNGIKKIVSQVSSYILGKVRKLADGITYQTSNVTSRLSDLVQNVSGIFGSFGESFYSSGAALINNFWEGVKSAWSGFSSWLTDSLSRIAGMLPSSEPEFGPLVGLKARGESLIGTFGEGIQNALPNLTGTLTTGFGHVYEALTSGYKIPEPALPTEKFPREFETMPSPFVKLTELREPSKVISPAINFEPHIEIKIEGANEIDPNKLANDIWHIIRDKQNEYVLNELTRVLKLE